MLIRIVLLLGIALIAYQIFLKRNKLPFHLVVLMGLLAIAAMFVVFPEATSKVAQWMGVGRGADLITYVVELALVFVVIHYYTKFVTLQSELTRVVRELALLRGSVDELHERATQQTGGDSN